ncbi:MAG TPA: hypothetical protein VNN80_25005 [Polyangiaceae bacterium]|jgi:hypothetical protein|nr:hypothetical protein [Polyangiaceae bacterium]
MSDDPELRRFLDAVVNLSAERHGRGPDAVIGSALELGHELEKLRKYRSDRVLCDRFEAFAKRRFALVDDPSECALAADEVLVLSLAAGDAAQLAVPAMQHAVRELSGALAEDGVPELFGQLLKRLQRLGRQHADRELLAWVEGVARALPGE